MKDFIVCSWGESRDSYHCTGIRNRSVYELFTFTSMYFFLTCRFFLAGWLTFIVENAPGPISNWITFCSRYQATLLLAEIKGDKKILYGKKLVLIWDLSPPTCTECQRPDRQSCYNASIAKQNRFLCAETNKIQRSSSGAGSSLQNLVFQKTRSRKSRFKQEPIFSIISFAELYARRHNTT